MKRLFAVSMLAIVFNQGCFVFGSEACFSRGRLHHNDGHAAYRPRPTVAGMYNYIQPLVASIVAICWGMDSFSMSKLASAMLIFEGVYMVTVNSSGKSRV